MDVAALGIQRAGLAGVAEEGDRRLGAEQDDVFGGGELLQRHIDDEHGALDIDPAGAAFPAPVGAHAEQPAASRRLDLADGFQRPLAQHRAGHHDDRFLARFQQARGLDHAVGVDARAGRRRQGGGRRLGIFPGGVAGQDQSGDLTGRGLRRLDRLGAMLRNLFRAARLLDPMGHRRRVFGDIGGQRRVIFVVIGGVVADDVDDGRHRPPGVVQIGHALGQTGAQMEPGRGRFVGHPREAIGHAGDAAFEQTEHATHAIDLVEGGDEMHFGRAGIGETHINARANHCAH